MKLNDFAKGLQILQLYYTDSDDCHIGCTDGQFYAYATDFPLNAKDVQRMFALGWFQTSGKVNTYNPCVEWSVLL